MKTLTKEFIKYGSGEDHERIIQTLIKEIYVDNGKFKQFQDAGTFGLELSNNLIAGQNIYVDDINKLTYSII